MYAHTQAQTHKHTKQQLMWGKGHEFEREYRVYGAVLGEERKGESNVIML